MIIRLVNFVGVVFVILGLAMIHPGLVVCFGGLWICWDSFKKGTW